MHPALLDAKLESALNAEGNGPTIVAYGDCSPHMREFSAGRGRARTEGINCAQIALGSGVYRELRREGSFFFMPEWAERWKEIFSQGLGFHETGLERSFLRESASLLVYVDTGCAEIPTAILDEISEHFDLPFRIVKAGLAGIEAALRKALEEAVRES